MRQRAAAELTTGGALRVLTEIRFVASICNYDLQLVFAAGIRNYDSQLRFSHLSGHYIWLIEP
jgi:hypothetical protein